MGLHVSGRRELLLAFDNMFVSLLDEGDTLLFRIGIALVRLLSARLYVPEKEEVRSS